MTAAATHAWHALTRGLAIATITAFALIGLAGAVQAQSILLTDQQVTGFIASYPEIVALSDEFEETEAPAEGDLTASLGALMTYQDAMGRLNATVAAHGFTDYSEWMQVVSAITIAYTFAAEGGGMDAEMEAAIAAIEANPNLTAEQKQVMLAQFEQAAASMNAAKPQQENIDLVNAHAAELEVIFNQ